MGALFLAALAWVDWFGVCRMAERLDDGALCPLALGHMLEIDWDSTYAMVSVTRAGRYLY